MAQVVKSHSDRIAAEYGFLNGLSKLRSLGAFASQDEVIDLLMQNRSAP
jgi:hypothetical protein